MASGSGVPPIKRGERRGGVVADVGERVADVLTGHDLGIAGFLEADSLNTQQNYVLEASPVALRLASNEYVTEVMFVFGVVPANFRQVEAPKIDCTVVQSIRYFLTSRYSLSVSSR